MSTEFRPDPARIVLIVEDEPVLRASMVRGLSKLPGVDVVDAASVRDAKELLRALDADLLISDLDLPDGSGVELAAEMDLLGKRAPIVFVSAYVRKYKGQLPARADVEVQEKPVSLSRLRALVEERLGAPHTNAASPFNVADYVQLAAMGRRSVALDVRQDGTLCGRIVIRAGEVWSARDRKGMGLDAFRRLAFARDVVVTCGVVANGESERTIHGSAEGVLLEAARLLDESETTVEEAEVLDLELDEGWEEERKPATFSGERPKTDVARVFEEHFEHGVDALLVRDFPAAFAAFLAASALRPDDPRVVANLSRLREMGHGGDAP
jgi:two-component system, NtrC family, response regulator PilR